MIKAVLIDIDNTLLDFNKCAYVAMKASFEDMNGSFDDSMFPVFKRINDGLWRAIEKKEITQKELFECRWNTVFKELNVPLNGVEFERIFLKYMETAAEPVEYANELLEYLSQKYLLCAASNAPHEQQLIRLKKAGMLQYLKFVFTSESTGHNKPSQEFFVDCFKCFPDIKPEETLIIGDSLSADINGGAKFGMKTCWFNYKGMHVPSHNRADFVVSSLKSVKSIL